MRRHAVFGRVVLGLVVLAPVLGASSREGEVDRPNVVIVLTDDQGYADLGCYGARGFETPHLDKLASEGTRFTDFHVSQGVCSASRASLLTGCYAERVSIRGALGPSSRTGLNPDEETLAELLGARGYATGAFGKWHLGHHAPFLPLNQGFDEYFGLAYSNDMWPVDYDGSAAEPGERVWRRYPPLRLIEGNEPAQEVRSLEDQARLTELYTRRALRFIDAHADEPFFLYLAHSMPHVPLGRPLRLEGQSEQGAYGDVISEIDRSMGRILAALESRGLTGNTIVVFTSDNGPWLRYGDHAGSAGGLREGKLTGWEGGHRVPCVVRWPKRVPAGRVCDELVSTIDLLPTIAAATGARLPARPIDGVNALALFEGRHGVPPRRSLHHYYGGELVAVRRDGFKLVFPHTYPTIEGVAVGAGGFPGPEAQGRTGLALFDLDADPGESANVSADHPEVVRELEALADAMRHELGDRLRQVRGRAVRPPGRLAPARPSPRSHLAIGKAVDLSREPDPAYPGAAGPGLVDGILGSEDFSDGTWLGYRGVDFVATIDLGAPQPVERIGCSFLRSQTSWIFLPRSVEFAVSTDGEAFVVVSNHEPELEIDRAEEALEFAAPVSTKGARYVRVRAASIGPCPEGHPGAGEPAWLFVDEIVVD